MPRIYHTRNGVQYYDWELCNLSTNITLNEDYIYLTYGVDIQLGNMLNEIKKNQFVPKPGSEINIVPRCSESIDNIRKCYTIKRGIDTGVCNVFSTIWPSVRRSTGSIELAICPSLKKICIYHYDYNDQGHISFTKILENIYASNNIPECDFLSEVIFERVRLYPHTKNEAWESLLKGTLKKPAIHISNINLNTGDELTADVLSLVHLTGSVQANEPDAEKNFVLQLNVLNNYNWREYPHTMYLLFGQILLRIPGGIERRMHYHPSYFKQAYNKIVKQFIREFKNPASEITQKDFDMAQGMLKKILNVDNTIFVSPSSLVTKLKDKGIDMNIFEKYFSSIVKITPKTNNCA